jgi:hypothetical protein
MYTKYCRREECLNYGSMACKKNSKLNDRIRRFEPVECEEFIRKVVRL